jgi:hypothetical protein
MKVAFTFTKHKSKHLPMKRYLTHLIFGLLPLSILLTGCPPIDIVGPGDTQNGTPLGRLTITPKTVAGGKFPSVGPLNEELNEDDKPSPVPLGKVIGNMTPRDPATKVDAADLDGRSEAPVFFPGYNELDDAQAASHPINPEPTVAENGETILTAGNFWVALSLDGGGSFNSVNPTTIFPENYGGFCCDQVLNYVPEYDLFVWLLQYRADASGQNAIRIAVQTTDKVRSSNGTAWTYWDFTNDQFAANGVLDRNDMSFGNNYVYWSTSVNGGNNRYAIRMPLKELAAKSVLSAQFAGPSAARFSHVTQNGGNAVYWAGHKDNSTLTVFSMEDNENVWRTRDVNVNSWPQNIATSIAKDGNDWLADGAQKYYIRAAAMRGVTAIFAWNASAGGGFPQPHVQIVEINTRNWTLSKQMQVWNRDFAFAYPYFETNSKGELGMITGFGGGDFDASNGVGVWGDFVIYYPRLSSASQTNYGHYITARRSGTKSQEWVATGYTYEADGTVLPYYIGFRH